MPRLNKTSAILCAAGAMISVCCLFTACNNADNKSVSEEKVPTTYVAVDINPSVEFVLDQNDSVMSVTGINTDAKVLLFNEGGIVGSKIDDALAHVIGLAKESDMLSDENGNIGLSVYSSGGAAERVYDSLDDVVTQFGRENGIELTSEHTVDLALSYELDHTDAASGAGAMSLERYRLVKRVSQYTDDDITATAAMTDRQLISKVRDVQADSDTKLGKLYDRAVTEAKFVLESATVSAKDSLYALYFADKTFEDWPLNYLTNSRRWAYANIYLTLHSLSLNLNHYYNSLNEYLHDPVFSFDDLRAAFERMKSYLSGETDKSLSDKLVDENGDITSDSVNAYLNGVYRNLPREQRNGFKAQYVAMRQEILDNPPVEQHVKYITQDSEQTVENTGIGGIKKQLSEAFEAIKDDINNSRFLQKLSDWLSDALDTLGLSDMYTQLRERMSEITDNLDDIDFASLFDIKRAIERVDKVSDWAYDKMELGDEDLAKVAALESNITEQLKDAKASFESTLADAKKAATQWFADAKLALGI